MPVTEQSEQDGHVYEIRQRFREFTDELEGAFLKFNKYCKDNDAAYCIHSGYYIDKENEESKKLLDIGYPLAINFDKTKLYNIKGTDFWVYLLDKPHPFGANLFLPL